MRQRIRWRVAFILGLWIGPVFSLSGQSPEIERAVREARGLEAQGKLAEAVRAWQQLVARHPEDLSGWSSLGVVLARQGRLDEAVGPTRRRSNSIRVCRKFNST